MARGIGLAAVCWGGVLALADAGVGVRDTSLTVGALVLALLLVLAPAGLALPAGQALAAPGWSSEVIVSWAALGALLLLANPTGLGRPLAMLLLLPPFFGACASPTLLLAAWCLPNRAASLRRWGYLLAAFPVGLASLAALDALTPITALLFVLLFGVGGLLYAVSTAPPAPEVDLPSRPLPAPATPDDGAGRPPVRPVIALASRGRAE